MPIGMTIIGDLIPPERKMQGLFGTVFGLSSGWPLADLSSTNWPGNGFSTSTCRSAFSPLFIASSLKDSSPGKGTGKGKRVDVGISGI